MELKFKRWYKVNSGLANFYRIKCKNIVYIEIFQKEMQNSSSLLLHVKK